MTDERGALFLGYDLTPVDAAPDPTEAFELWRLPVDEAITLAYTGRIADSLSLVGLLHLGLTRQRGRS